MSPRRSVGRDAPGTATRRKVRRARAPHGRRHATASHRGRRDRIAVRTARARAAPYQRRTAWDAASAGYGTGSQVEYLLVPRVFGLGGPRVAMVGTNMGAGQRDRAMRAAWIGAAMATGLTEMIGLGAAAVPYAWLSLFDTDPAMLGAGARPGAHAVAHAGWGLVGPPGCPSRPRPVGGRGVILFLVYTCICMFLPGDCALEE